MTPPAQAPTNLSRNFPTPGVAVGPKTDPAKHPMNPAASDKVASAIFFAHRFPIRKKGLSILDTPMISALRHTLMSKLGKLPTHFFAHRFPIRRFRPDTF